MIVMAGLTELFVGESLVLNIHTHTLCVCGGELVSFSYVVRMLHEQDYGGSIC